MGIVVMAMVRSGWFGLDRVYAAFPVIPFALVIVWLADEL